MTETPEELQTLFEAIPDALLQLNKVGHIVKHNAVASTLLSNLYLPTPLTTNSTFKLEELQARDGHGQLVTYETSPLTHLLQGQPLLGPNTPIVRLPLKNGREHYFQISGQPQKDLITNTITGIVVLLRDVTISHNQRRQLEETLLQRLFEQRSRRAQEERAQHISSLQSETATDYAYVYHITPDGQLRCEWASDAILRITGYSASEFNMMGWDLLHLYHPEDLAAVTARMAAMHAGEADVQEWRIITKIGTQRWLRDACHSERDPDTGVVRIYGIAEDITERKNAEARAHQLTQQLSVTFEAITDGILIFASSGQLLQTNQAAQTILEPLVQSPHYPSLHTQIFEDTHTADIQITALDGSQLFLNISGSPIKDQDLTLLGAVLVVRDVTERRLHQQRTQQSLETLLKIAASLAEFPDHVLQQTHNDEASQILQQACHLFHSPLACIISLETINLRMHPIALQGFTQIQAYRIEHELDGVPLRGLLADEQLALLHVGETVLLDDRQLLTGILQSYDMQHIILTPLWIGSTFQGLLAIDGTNIEQAFPLHEVLTLCKAIGRLAALVLEREHLIQERTIAQSNMIAEIEANKQKDAFIRLASHELRTPLATIKASIQITRRRLKRLVSPNTTISTQQIVQQVEEMLNRGERQVGIENRLIENLLDVSRIQEHGLELKPRLFNLLDLVQNTLPASNTEDNPHIIHLHLPPEDHLPVIADSERIEQVINSYLSNAIKYAPEETPIDISIHKEGKSVRFAITDQGPGLTITQQSKVWERFYQVPERFIYNGSSGMGLGLYISHIIIRQHHGQVGVESLPDQGATFWFRLPLAHT